jgi:hypothetical protein
MRELAPQPSSSKSTEKKCKYNEMQAGNSEEAGPSVSLASSTRWSCTMPSQDLRSMSCNTWKFYLSDGSQPAKSIMVDGNRSGSIVLGLLMVMMATRLDLLPPSVIAWPENDNDEGWSYFYVNM